MPSPAKAKQGGPPVNNQKHLQQLLRQKIEENEQLVEYLAELEREVAASKVEIEQMQSKAASMEKVKEEAVSCRQELDQVRQQYEERLETLHREAEMYKKELNEARDSQDAQMLAVQKEVSKWKAKAEGCQSHVNRLSEELLSAKGEAGKWKKIADTLTASNSSLEDDKKAGMKYKAMAEEHLKEIDQLRGAVLSLRDEVSEQQAILDEKEDHVPSAQYARVKGELDRLKQALADAVPYAEHMKVVDEVAKLRQMLKGGAHPQAPAAASTPNLRSQPPPPPPGLPPLPPGSPPAAAVPSWSAPMVPYEGDLDLDGHWPVHRSEAPSRGTSGSAETPSLAEVRTASAGRPMCYSESQPRTTSFGPISDSDSTPALSISPVPSSTLRSSSRAPCQEFMPVEVSMMQFGDYPLPHSRSTSPGPSPRLSYASQAATRAIQLSRQSPTSPRKYRSAPSSRSGSSVSSPCPTPEPQCIPAARSRSPRSPAGRRRCTATREQTRKQMSSSGSGPLVFSIA